MSEAAIRSELRLKIAIKVAEKMRPRLGGDRKNFDKIFAKLLNEILEELVLAFQKQEGLTESEVKNIKFHVGRYLAILRRKSRRPTEREVMRDFGNSLEAAGYRLLPRQRSLL